MVVDPAELKDLIEPKDLTGDLALISSVCGLDVAKAIATELSGVSLYISDAALNHSRVSLKKKFHLSFLYEYYIFLKCNALYFWSKLFLLQIQQEHFPFYRKLNHHFFL